MADTGVATDLLEYTVFSSPINLYAVKGRAPRKIRIIGGSGTVTVKLSSSGGVARVLTMATGDEELGEFTSIDSVSGVTSIRVSW